jgi:hypothetical protein
MSETKEPVDPLKWLEAMAIQVGDQAFADAADELRKSREALREIEDRAGYDRGAEWCRDRAREARLGR